MDDSLKTRILVVDDQQHIRFGISRILKQSGYDTLEAVTGKECLEYAHKFKPALILLDVLLDDMDGKEVCRILKMDPLTTGIPVLLVSSTMTDLDNQADGMNYGADGCISKPIHNRELVARIRAILRIKESEKSLAETLDFVSKILTASPVGIATLKQDGLVVTANGAMTKFMEENLRESLERIEGESRLLETLKLKDLAQEVLETGSESRKEVYWQTESGEEFWLDCYLALFKSKDEPHLLLTANDVTSLRKGEREKEKLIEELRGALSQVKSLSGLLPICSSCKKIRDDSGYWRQIEAYIRDHSEADFTHSICPECAKKLYPEIFKD
ncbi:MAG: response regulator [Desulfomonilaceae bacterium]